MWFPNQPFVASESWLVFESWLVSDSTVLVIDNIDTTASGVQRMCLVSESAVVVSESAFCSFRIMVGV